MEQTKPTKTTFDEIVSYILYIILAPTLLALFIGKLILNCFCKKIIILTLKKKDAYNKILFYFGIILYLICIVGLIMTCIWLNHKISIWLFICIILLINVFGVIVIQIPLGILIMLQWTKKANETFTKENKVEILAKAASKQKKSTDIKSLFYFFTNKLKIESVVNSLGIQQRKEELHSNNIGVVLNKERGIYIPADALNYGTTVLGTTGGGKTNSLKLCIEFGIKNRENILFINGKEDFDLCEDLKILCENNGYNIKVWSPTYKLNSVNKFIYNPFKNKSSNLITSLLMEIGRYSLLEETTPGAIYYKDNELACINLICKMLIYKQENHNIEDQTDYSISLDNLFKFSDLEILANNLEYKKILGLDKKEYADKQFKFWTNIIERTGKLELNDAEFSKKFSKIRSDAWFSYKENEDKIFPEGWINDVSKFKEYSEKKLVEAKFAKDKVKGFSEDDEISKMKNAKLKNIFEDFLDIKSDDDKTKALRQIKTTFRNLRNINTEENKIISNDGVSIEEAIQASKPTLYLFSLNTTGLKTQSSAVARMLIADVKQNMNVIRQNDKTKNMMMILDEFGSFATPDIVELQEQGRSKGFQIIYGIQTLANLTSISESFASRIIGNCNTYIIHRTKEDKGVETIANIIGTNPAYEATERHSEGVATGEQSVREVQQYIFHPKDIRQLENHYALVCTMFNNKVTPFKGAIKIDYADIKNFITTNSDNKSYANNKQQIKFTPKEIPII